MSVEMIRERIATALPCASLQVVAVNESCGKFAVNVVSSAFAGIPMLQRHRMITGLFAEELASNAIHALEIVAKPPPAPAAAAAGPSEAA